jgi:hypothetical protein
MACDPDDHIPCNADCRELEQPPPGHKGQSLVRAKYDRLSHNVVASGDATIDSALPIPQCTENVDIVPAIKMQVNGSSNFPKGDNYAASSHSTQNLLCSVRLR